ncbi:GTP-sensing pleiotropic transcriptional regulator CodY [Granulicatella sp. zg-84]|uniref:GTP-sensing pleiotropic transcriptional regulator CodY n=1 Tax=unclassified Granulicatella TaxID=2630493 RepID=UPI0031F6149D
MEQVLSKLRELMTLLQTDRDFSDIENIAQTYKDLPFKRVAKILSGITDSNIYIVDNNGIILGYDELYTMDSPRFTAYLEQRQFPDFYIQELNKITKTYENITVDESYTAFPVENKDIFGNGVTTIIPIFVSGKRLGNLSLARIGKLFETSDLILAEYSATVVGLELLYYINHKEQEEIREKERISLAISSLSYSEKEAIRCIFSTISTLEVRITASKIATDYNITRSVIVNALRKLESAGLLEAQSLGMKGTHIKLKNNTILEELKYMM